MMLALPVQTFASAAMLGCTFSHQEPGAHQKVTQHMAMAEEEVAACHEPKLPDTSSTQHTCKHCAACYLASALPIPVASAAPIVPLAHSVIAHPDATFIGFIPDSPERPPRTHFA